MKTISTIDSSEGKLQLRKTDKNCANQLPVCSQSRADDAFDACVYILCRNKLLKELEGRFKDSKRINSLHV
jgi:hypothetical protein